MSEMIKNKRMEKNMSLEMVANLIGCPISELDEIENEKDYKTKGIYLLRLSKLLEIDYDDLLLYKCANYHRDMQLNAINRMKNLIPVGYYGG